MRFPAYVPKAVREKITHYLDGESDRSIPGYVGLLASANAELAKIERAIASQISRGKDEYLPSLRQQRAEAVAHRDYLSKDVACLRRLAKDLRMCEVFTLLQKEKTKDEQLSAFIFSAWVAWVDYGRYRAKLKRATEINGEIANAAAHLANLIRQYSSNGVNGLDEFWSVAELLRKTDNHDMQDHNLAMWRAFRGHLLGDMVRQKSQQDGRSKAKPANGKAQRILIRFVESGDKVDIDPGQQARDTLRYIWGLAPDLPALLETVAKAAQVFTPSETGMIGAAISTRQHNVRTEYIRGFASRLTDSRVAISTNVMRAMAVVANVVIDDPASGTSYDDVRKTIKKINVEKLSRGGA